MKEVNEFAGYGAVALSALATGYIAAAYGLRPQPFSAACQGRGLLTASAGRRGRPGTEITEADSSSKRFSKTRRTTSTGSKRSLRSSTR